MFPEPSEPPSAPTRKPLNARLHVAAALARCPIAVLYRLDGVDGWLVEAHGPVGATESMAPRIPAWRVKRDAVAVVPVIGRGPATPESALFAPELRVRALVSAPLFREGEQVGTLLLAGPDGDDVSSLDLDALDAMCALLVDALVESSAVRTSESLPPFLAEQAAWPLDVVAHDLVTGLPGLGSIEQTAEIAIDAARNNGLSVVVATVSLARFQRIDDWLGRTVSDEVMRHAAERILETTRECDLVGRAGDEFVVVFTGLPRGSSPLAHAYRMAQSFEQPFHVHGYELNISPKIGISRFPEDADEVPLLLRYSGIALRRATSRGRREVVQTFTPELREAVEQRGDLERHLRRAITNDELRLHYQPKVDLASRRVTSVEALIRWQRGERLVSPGLFLPLAEESELIVPIGAWVMREACRQMQKWRSHGVPLDSVSVNVSALQFARPDFVQSVARVLRNTTLPPGSLEIEVTETSLMDDVSAAADKLTELREMGVHVSVDDFGTGYSSLAYLQQLPVDVLKVDRSFVKDLDAGGLKGEHAHALAQAITGLGHSLGLEVLAEGVETEAQLEAVTAVGCDSVQGYYFARPMPAADLRASLVPGSIG